MVGELACSYLSETSLLTKSLFSMVHSFDAVLCTCTCMIFEDRLGERLGFKGSSLLLVVAVLVFLVVWRAVFRAGALATMFIVSF